MLDQLSLFGKRITKSLVNELMGVVFEDKLLDLSKLAMSSNATETVRRARELMDSSVDPLVLISQLVTQTLIVDIIAGTYSNTDAKHNYTFFGGRTCKFISVAFLCLSGDGLRVATGSYSNLFRVFGFAAGSNEATTLEANKNPMRKQVQTPSRSLTNRNFILQWF